MSGSIIYITGSCNQNCVFCLGSNTQMDTHVLEKKISGCKDRLIISGGEPIMSDHVDEVLDLAKGVKEVEFQSNGVPFYSMNNVNKVLGKVTEMNINFPAHTPELDRELTKTDYFEYRVKGVKNLIGAGLAVRLTFVIVKQNLMHIKDYLSFVNAEFKGNVSVQLSFVQNQGNAMSNNLMPRYEEIEISLSDGLKYAREHNMKVMVDNVPLCIMNNYKSMNVDFIKSKVKDRSFHNKVYVHKCRNCPSKDHCYGYPSDYLKVHGESDI